ncbi:MAG: TetR family transcriptional regulator [Microbacteriaceae bacterium]|nr:TetR family transcriptional regulator [Microbacteriaceae bacterium]
MATVERDALLAIGADLLAEDGANLPFEEVARVAVVGKGTLYRHFPTRDHLIAAVLRQRFDQLADEADELLISTSPSNAVNMWLRSFDRIPERFRRTDRSSGRIPGGRLVSGFDRMYSDERGVRAADSQSAGRSAGARRCRPSRAPRRGRGVTRRAAVLNA